MKSKRELQRKFLVLSVFLMWLMPWCANALEVGKVEYVRGAVTAQHVKYGVRIMGKGALVYEEDVINTGDRSFVIIKMKDGTKMTVRPNSSLGVEKYIARGKKSDSAILNLFRGGIRAVTGFISKQRKDSYKIKTAVATIGIRGTEFDARLCDKDCQKDNTRIAKQAVIKTGFVIARVAFTRGSLSATDRYNKTRQLFVGGPLYEGDRLKTGFSSFAVISFKDKSRVTLQENSDFEIKKHHYEKKQPTLSKSLMVLFRGGVRAVSGLIGKRNRSNYEMRTPVATIGIRGTGYDLQCEGDCVSGQRDIKNSLFDSITNFLMKPVVAELRPAGMYAHVWQGAIELKNDSGVKLLSLNETAFLQNMKSVPKIVPVLPLFMRSTPAPRPDTVKPDENLFTSQKQQKAEPGLYVTVYDGHVNVTSDKGNKIDLGKGESAFAGLKQAQKAVVPVRLSTMPAFQVNDSYPRPESFNENWENLYNDATNPDENQDMECVAK